jgi:hypothetical protein
MSANAVAEKDISATNKQNSKSLQVMFAKFDCCADIKLFLI